MCLSSQEISLSTAVDEIISGLNDNPPFSFEGPDGNPQGFDVDALNWIIEKSAQAVIHIQTRWDNFELLQDKGFDVIASGLSITPEREQLIAFTRPYWTITQVVVVKNDSTMTLKNSYHRKDNRRRAGYLG
jgi:polar amino acid transport system substrate-binding protein